MNIETFYKVFVNCFSGFVSLFHSAESDVNGSCLAEPYKMNEKKSNIEAQF